MKFGVLSEVDLDYSYLGPLVQRKASYILDLRDVTFLQVCDISLFFFLFKKINLRFPRSH